MVVGMDWQLLGTATMVPVPEQLAITPTEVGQVEH
jgi:hypothetical protein